MQTRINDHLHTDVRVVELDGSKKTLWTKSNRMHQSKRDGRKATRFQSSLFPPKQHYLMPTPGGELALPSIRNVFGQSELRDLRPCALMLSSCASL